MRMAGCLAAALLLGACAVVDVGVDYDPGQDFSGYSTFTWLPDFPQPTGDYRVDSPLLDARVRAAVEATLAAKGYRKVVDRTPDFYVTYYLSIETRIDVYTLDQFYLDYWGYGILVPETQVWQYEQGTLVIDIVDSARKALVWRGAGSDGVWQRATPEKTVEHVDAAVSEILERFPPPR